MIIFYLLNGTHQVLAYEDDVNLFGDIRTIDRNAYILLNACTDFGLAVNKCKTKYMKVGRHCDLIANEHIRIGSNSYEKVKTLKYLGPLMTNQISIHEEIKHRPQAGNSSYYSILTLLSS